MKKRASPSLWVPLLITIWAVLAFALLLDSSSLIAKDKKTKPEKDAKIADYALIKGSVFREDGFSIQGARVSCRRVSDSKPKWETSSGDGGEFAFRLPVGKMQYIVTADLKGFEPGSKTVEITNDERQDISIVLIRKNP
jgi:hypothetical protein